MTAKEILRKLMDKRLKNDELVQGMKDVGDLKFNPHFGVPQNKRIEVRKELSDLVKGAWIKGEGNVETFFRLCYLADYLELQLFSKASQSRRREKEIARFLFERYKLGRYKDLDSYLSIMKLI